MTNARSLWRWVGTVLGCVLLASTSVQAKPKGKGVATKVSSAGKALPAKPPIEGYWDTVAGRVELRRDDKLIVGALTTPADGVQLAPGTKVLQGVFEDDNLSAEMRLELITASCMGDSTKAFGMLLLTRKGKLTGGVSAKAPCAAEASAVSFERSADQSSKSKVRANAAPVPGAGQYDALGRRTKAMDKAVRALMDDGAAYLQEGQFEKARKQFEAALVKDPNVGEAYNGVGVTHAMRNDYEAAIEWYKKGLEAAPGFGDLYYNLACAYAQSGKKSMALRYFKLAVKKGYDQVEAIDGDTDLDPLREEPEFVAIRKQLGGEKAESKPNEPTAAP